jgi:hypothetical protein
LTILVVGLCFNWGRPLEDFRGHQGAAVVQGASFRHSVVPGGVPIVKPVVKMHDLSRLGSMTKVGKLQTLCGGRCKIRSPK